ncbi:hypothetical protein B0A67_12925 [Flavobacterium aquidurense]|jgi:hypothetical protein|uniref:hypothetical protein n=1 Tax=Flavobacterium aquidurense TaxID=362413 RepID=UPI000921834F|nr:hypothetical protein [Flavobacterium aquidurense]OXA71164.1 hypothetical protein B0A67_12925 [Flavobacterium aquidurense]SHG66551.1 hypothetical protein SAMN05444481_106130 [Flavobacterium frigidimaris]
MLKEITVNEALKKGRAKLVYLPMFVTFAIIILSIVLSTYEIVSSWIILIGFVAGFLCGWLTWSYFVNKWKIWAFGNVRNVRELKRKAIEQKLIWKDDSWFEKTEFKSLEQKTKLKSLEKKFLEKDIYQDDINVPKETIIFYSKTSLVFLLVISIGMISIGVYFLLKKDYYMSILIVMGLYLCYDQIKKLRDNNPQITINAKGIKLKNEKMVSWNKIYDERVFTQKGGRNSTNYLAFNDEMVDIGDLTIKFEELEKLLQVYRVRFENQN